MLEDFASFLGLKINWDKSQILPIDPIPPVVRDLTLPLQWLTQFKYLGVQVTNMAEGVQVTNMADFITLNFAPLLGLSKAKFDLCQSLPLLLIGRINLIKMKLHPVFLYTLRNVPVWILISLFQQLDIYISSFLWSNKSPKFSISTLKHPMSLGGLALPKFFQYFLAGQLMHAHNWLVLDKGNASVVAEAAVLGSYEALQSLLYRGCRAPYILTYTMNATIKAWNKTGVLHPSVSCV